MAETKIAQALEKIDEFTKLVKRGAVEIRYSAADCPKRPISSAVYRFIGTRQKISGIVWKRALNIDPGLGVNCIEI